MPAFLVRQTGDKQLVGIFAVLSSDDLPRMVDECTSGDCEFVLLPAGGIMWTGTAVTIPVPSPDPDEAPPMRWADADMSGNWHDFFYSSVEGWRPLESALVGYAGLKKPKPASEH
jgi:hypothetical protein